MNEKWKDIWNGKSLENIELEKDEFSIFCDLKKADGFDVNVQDENSYFEAFYNEWLDMYRRLNKIVGDSIGSVYEVGCGSGVNLYLFQNRIKNIAVGGIDYSQGLIDVAKNIVHGNDLVCGNAEQMDTDNKYDLVMADSVFQYFGSLNYAEDILNRMIVKSRRVVYLSEIHNLELRDEWLEHRRSSMENYDRIYEGLDKMFYSKDWIMDIAGKQSKQAVFWIGENPEYWNSRYVFNCFIF